ncbi:MAG: primosomal protein N' [Gammaproteobacteria bacterium]|nr:primosomal protein N' [Gammaproteobacteria bacterium]
MSSGRFLEVAVFAPLRSTFDYLCPSELKEEIRIGARVEVPFAHGRRLGVVLRIRSESAIAPSRLKSIFRILDAVPLIDEMLFSLAVWVAEYYHHPIGEVFEALLPTKLRRTQAPEFTSSIELVITDGGRQALETVRLGLRQQQLLRLGLIHPLTKDTLRALDFDTGRVTRQLLTCGWLAAQMHCPDSKSQIYAAFLALNSHQQRAFTKINSAPPGYSAHLLHGVTGSGKTEIYLHLIRDIIRSNRQALVLVPEIGLTEQLVRRFRERFGDTVAVVHSDLNENTRAAAWQSCRQQRAQVLLGTRSAVWLPLPALGIVIVDEEHDLSYKQQDGLRYSARDVAVFRAHRAEIPVVLGSATPSLESLANCNRGKYEYIEISERAGEARMPQIKLIDIRGLPLTAGMSEPLRLEIDAALSRSEQSLIFLNRRGYAPIILCHRCGWIAVCERCDARMVLHKNSEQLRCHHCGAGRVLTAPFAAHSCGPIADYVDLGVGTEQIEEALTRWFPARTIVRIDRDSMPRRGQLEEVLAQVRARQVDVLVGTQMISKGHDFAGITLVGIVDADSRLHANDFRAEERFIQMVMQVAGRAGRAERAGLVLIQTHHPHHPIFEFILSGRYKDFAQSALRERAAAQLPPYHSLALLRAEAVTRSAPLQFLEEIAGKLRRHTLPGVSIDGPVPALMEKRVGKFRANLLVTATDRGALSSAITKLLETIENSPTSRRVRWSVDVDAQEIG